MRLPEQLCRGCQDLLLLQCSQPSWEAGDRGHHTCRQSPILPSASPPGAAASIRQAQDSHPQRFQRQELHNPPAWPLSDQGLLIYYLTHNRSEVYSKRTIIMLKIKLVLVQHHHTCKHIPSKQRGIFQPWCPTVTYEAVLWLCFHPLNYTQRSQWKPPSSISFRLAGLCQASRQCLQAKGVLHPHIFVSK